MPLTMTIDGSDKIPSVTPCFEGEELNLDSELVSAGLSAISVKGYDAGDRRGETGIRHRNSFWSVHRPELSKLSWAVNHAPQNIETYLKTHAGDKQSKEKFKRPIIPSDTFDKLTVIHQTSGHQTDIDKLDKQVSKPETIQFSDHDLESHTTLHKKNTSEPSGSRANTKFSQKLLFNEDYLANDIRLEQSDVKINSVWE
ncbi:uncharacterized protein LOC105688952 isoform X2 [Athalia rosae]|uniref:uncharacterized protein LOC105688952 isoform X2 n=1 Tax=Athalia rosae TaxID=37344 RepID=UPI002034A0B1|nr:uncharacterized protein LOC105688952 isoform X2 [Athalia rosae]